MIATNLPHYKEDAYDKRACAYQFDRSSLKSGFRQVQDIQRVEIAEIAVFRQLR